MKSMQLPLLALGLGAFAIGITEFAPVGLLLDIARDLNVSVSDAGLVVSGYALGVVLGAPLIPLLSGRCSERTLIIALMTIFVVGNGLSAIADPFSMLVMTRVIAAISHGVFFGVGSVIAAKLVGPERQASAIAFLFAGLTLANVLGVPLGTWVGQTWGWRSLFVAVFALALIALLLLNLWLPKGDGPMPVIPWKDVKSVLTSPRILSGFTMTALGFGGTFATLTYIAPMLTQVSQFSESMLPYAMLLFGIGLVLGNPIGGRLADKNTYRALIQTLAALTLTLVALPVLMSFKAAMLGGCLLLGFTAFATVAPLQSWLLNQATPNTRPLVASFNIGAFNLGNAVGAAAGGWLLSAGLSVQSLPWLAALMPASALLICFMLKNRSGEPVASEVGC